MTDYLIIRHGETEGTVAGIHECRTSTRMTKKGADEISLAAEKISEMQSAKMLPVIDEIYFSPMLRCKDSLEILLGKIKYKGKPKSTRLLLEHNMGVYDGLTKEEVENLNPGFSALRASNRWLVKPPEGENYFMVMMRLLEFLLKIDDNSKKTVLIVAHKAVNKILVGLIIGISMHKMYDIDMPTGAVYYLKRVNSGYIKTKLTA